jgi:hypothetical protein
MEEKSNRQKTCNPAEWLAIQNNFAVHLPASEQQLHPRRHTIENQISYLHDRDA